VVVVNVQHSTSLGVLLGSHCPVTLLNLGTRFANSFWVLIDEVPIALKEVNVVQVIAQSPLATLGVCGS